MRMHGKVSARAPVGAVDGSRLEASPQTIARMLLPRIFQAVSPTFSIFPLEESRLLAIAGENVPEVNEFTKSLCQRQRK